MGRVTDAQLRYDHAMMMVARTPEPKGQKFPKGSRVRIADDLGDSMSFHQSGVNATVSYTYAHAYGGTDVKSYCLDIDNHGESAWYYEHQLTAIEGTPRMTRYIRVRRPPMRRKKNRNIVVLLIVALMGVLTSKLGALAIAAAIGGFLFDYSLMTIFAKDIPWYADCIVGLVICPVAVAVGLGCWVAVLCDVEPPFIPNIPVAEAPMEPTDA